MASPPPEENPDLLFPFGFFGNIPGGDLPDLDPGFHQSHHHDNFRALSNLTSFEFGDASQSFETSNQVGSKKRARANDSKAHKEKMRRDKLNDKFQELSYLLDPERPPKVDKTALLVDAIQRVIQLRDEAEKLKESSKNLQQKVDELKAEKNELREEKQTLKSEKEKLEHQLKSSSAQPGFLAHPSAISTPFAAPHQVYGNKLIPLVGYPAPSMWHFAPSAAVDSSKDQTFVSPTA